MTNKPTIARSTCCANAGITNSIRETPGTAPVQNFLEMMLINAFSPIRLI